MKKFKKISVILLCLTLALSLFACGEEEVIPGGDTVCQEHVDADKNGKCDVCDAAVALEDEKDPTTDDPTTDDPTTDDPTTDDPTTDDPTTDDPTTDDPTTDDPTEDDPTVDNPTTDDPTEDAPTVDNPTEDDTPSEMERYFDAIEEAIKGANTVKLTATVLMNKLSDPYPEEVNEEKVNGVVEAIIAKTEAGVSIKLVSKELLEDGKFGQIYDSYIIGDKVYTYTGEGNEYYEFDLSNKEMNGSLAGMLGGIAGIELPEISEDDLLMLEKLLIAAFEETFAIDENGNLVFDADAAPSINATLDELKAIDYEKQTIEETINDILAKAGLEVTVKDVLDELATYGATTVQEAYDALNAVLVEKTGMNDAELIAYIVEKAGGIDALLEKVAPMLEMYGMSAEDFKYEVTGLTTDGLKIYLKPMHFELTIDHIADMLMKMANGQMYEPKVEDVPEVTLADLVEMIKAQILPTPLAMMLGEDTVEWIMKTEVNKLAADLALVIGENFAFEGIKFSTGIDINFPSYGYEYDYETDDYIRWTIGNSVQIEISLDLAIEDTVTEIKLPDGAVITEMKNETSDPDYNIKDEMNTPAIDSEAPKYELEYNPDFEDEYEFDADFEFPEIDISDPDYSYESTVDGVVTVNPDYSKIDFESYYQVTYK